MDCTHEWESAREMDDHGVEVTVLRCRVCAHLWLPDFEDQPPSVPLLF